MLFAELLAFGETHKVDTREVELEIDLTMVALAERGTGVPIASLVPQLRLFAPYQQPNSWHPVLYQPFVALYAEDENVIRRDSLLTLRARRGFAFYRRRCWRGLRALPRPVRPRGLGLLLLLVSG
jgi:hypothetical protein